MVVEHPFGVGGRGWLAGSRAHRGARRSSGPGGKQEIRYGSSDHTKKAAIPARGATTATADPSRCRVLDWPSAATPRWRSAAPGPRRAPGEPCGDAEDGRPPPGGRCPAARPDAEEARHNEEEQRRLGIAHHEHEGRRGEGQEPDRAPASVASPVSLRTSTASRAVASSAEPLATPTGRPRRSRQAGGRVPASQRARGEEAEGRCPSARSRSGRCRTTASQPSSLWTRAATPGVLDVSG